MPGVLRPTIEKEILLLKRDPRVLVRLMVMPIAFIALFGMAFNAAQDKAKAQHPLIVFVDPSAKNADTIMKALPARFMLATAKSADEVKRAVGDERYDVGLIIPADFDPRAGHPALVVQDPDAQEQVRGPTFEAIRGISTFAYAGVDPRLAVVAPIDPGKGNTPERPTAFQLTVPGNAVLFGFFIALTCALGFAEERRSGTWRRLLSAPVPAWKLLVAKLVPYVVLGFIQVGTLFAIGVFAFGMKIYGSVPALIVLSIAVSCCATSLGLLIASFSSTEKQISSLGSVLILIMGLIGGCMFPRALMPHAMQQIGLAVPHGWALDGYYTLLVHRGAGFAEAAKSIGVVFGFAALFTLVGLRRFRFDA